MVISPISIPRSPFSSPLKNPSEFFDRKTSQNKRNLNVYSFFRISPSSVGGTHAYDHNDSPPSAWMREGAPAALGAICVKRGGRAPYRKNARIKSVDRAPYRRNTCVFESRFRDPVRLPARGSPAAPLSRGAPSAPPPRGARGRPVPSQRSARGGRTCSGGRAEHLSSVTRWDLLRAVAAWVSCLGFV